MVPTTPDLAGIVTAVTTGVSLLTRGIVTTVAAIAALLAAGHRYEQWPQARRWCALVAVEYRYDGGCGRGLGGRKTLLRRRPQGIFTIVAAAAAVVAIGHCYGRWPRRGLLPVLGWPSIFVLYLFYKFY